MQIGLIDFGGKRPNLALMKAATYHKGMGDTVKLNHPGEINYISCLFDKHKNKALAMADSFPNCVIGGPGYDPAINLPVEIDQCKPDYTLYDIDYGMGQLTKGCPNDCPWCVVPAMEGGNVRTVNHISDIANPKSKFVVLHDANFLACVDAPDHLREIYEGGYSVCFDQGLDIRFVNDFYAHLLAKIKIKNFKQTSPTIYFAWDRPEIEPEIRRGVETLINAGIKPWRMMCYVLINYNTTFEQDIYRVEVLRELGVSPLVMKYGKPSWEKSEFARYVNRKWLFKSHTWDEHKREVGLA